MKKRQLSVGCIAIFVAGAMMLMTGCGNDTPYSNYDLSEYVKVGEYKGLEYEKIKVSVSADEVDEEIESRLAAAAETVETDKGTVEDGDTINVAYEGKIDGETFEGGSSDSYDITIGTTSMIDGFVEGLIGKEVGETVTLDLRFPDDYGQEELNGKDVTFTVTINSMKIQKEPEYNLDFVKNNSEYDSLKDYEAAVKEELLAEKRESEESDMESLLWQEIATTSELIQYPEEKNQVKEDTLAAYKEAAKSADKEWSVYLEELGCTEEELDEQLTAYAEGKVFQEMLVYAIADAEGLEVTDKEYEEYMENMLAQSGYDEETFQTQYGTTIEEYCEQEGLRTSLLMSKVMDKVVEYGKEK